MITAGIDVGVDAVKVVVLKDGKVVSRSTASSGGGDRAASAEAAFQEALKSAGIKAADVNKIVATGQGKNDVSAAVQRVVEPVAAAKAARYLYPSARAVVDVGADQIRLVAMDSAGKIEEAVLNQKCAAGIGVFLRSISRRMGISLEEMSRMTGKAADQVIVNDSCAVFAGLDAVALLQDETPAQDIAQAVHEAMAARINAVLNDKVFPPKNATVLVGGVAKNEGIVKALKKRSGIKFMIPDEPEYACALGAALIGADIG
jgi:(R)-2-hydroxyacyl-CoA dehydratese activating ATPase